MIMISLSENKYNSELKRDDKKLKLWRNVGLMLTYKCSAACEFCYYHCDPRKSGLMPIKTAIGAWSALRRLAGDEAKVHITGGEPFLYFDHLAEIITEADRAGLGPVDLLETNGSWAKNIKDTIEHISFLESKGLKKLKISWDPFHAEYVDQKSVELLIETAREILGDERVLVRWEKYLQEPVSKIRQASERKKREIYKKTVAEYPIRFTGRASGGLAEMFAETDAEDFRGKSCKEAFLGSKGVHIDPFGNVFSGQCSGIIIGNVNETPLDQMWKDFDPGHIDVVSTVFSEGPFAFFLDAEQKGYERKAAYSSRCHICSDIRQFFFDNGFYNKIIGPCDCYGDTSATKETVLVRE